MFHLQHGVRSQARVYGDSFTAVPTIFLRGQLWKEYLYSWHGQEILSFQRSLEVNLTRPSFYRCDRPVLVAVASGRPGTPVRFPDLVQS